jgi:hypothetical protein
MGPRERLITCTVAVTILAACSSDHDPARFGRQQSSSPSTATAASSVPLPATSSTARASSATSASSAVTITSVAPAGELRGTAVAGAAGGVEPGAAPYTQTDPFSEAVRLADGSCVGWDGSRGGSTAGLQIGAPVAVLDPTTNAQLGAGTITASRWEDVSGGGGQWTCFFDFSATVTAAVPADALIRVGSLQPWTARPDPHDPSVRVASVSTDAAIGQIASCPALPAPTTTSPAGATTVATTTLAPTTTVPGPPVTAWNAIGQYWSIGVDSLCKAGLPVTALARPCRQPNAGSEYITEVVDSGDPTVKYANGAAIPAGTQLTVAVATGRPCG